MNTYSRPNRFDLARRELKDLILETSHRIEGATSTAEIAQQVVRLTPAKRWREFYSAALEATIARVLNDEATDALSGAFGNSR
jgi:hypothetical protein